MLPAIGLLFVLPMVISFRVGRSWTLLFPLTLLVLAALGAHAQPPPPEGQSDEMDVLPAVIPALAFFGLCASSLAHWLSPHRVRATDATPSE